MTSLRSTLTKAFVEHGDFVSAVANMEVDLVDMAGDAEISSDIPLIQNESSEDLEHQEHDSTSLHIFVWVLSLTAGISGILFGYE